MVVSFSKIRKGEEGADIWVGGKQFFCFGHTDFEILIRHLYRDAEKALDYKNSGLYISLDLFLTTGFYEALCSSHTE